MKKLLVLVIGLMFMQLAFAQEWNAQLVSSTDKEIVVELNVNGFNTNTVTTPNGDAVVITNKKMMLLAQAGEPNVPSAVIPAVVGDNALMAVEVVDAQYVDYQNVEVAPSKGDFPRSIDPEDVPYTYGAMYQQDAFYPSQIARLDEPYIHRDVRGQNMVVTPYLYNPVTKTLRVYNHLVLKMKNVGVDRRNVFENRTKSANVDREFNKMYQRRYINYAESMSRYTSIAEDGELLIICHDAFMTAMEPFVEWKKQIGRPTTMVGTSVAGNNANSIKAYIQSYYAEHTNLTDILLVGDVAQIPGVYISAGSGWNNYSGYGDAQYGQLAGNDYYNEVLVGRFCCETEAQVTNHVNKVLNYERDLDETATWLSVGQGVSKNEGAGSGHNGGEADYEHIDNIRTDLLNYNYTEVHRDYQGVSGVTSNANIVSQHINNGVSIINYCNHGDVTLWGVFSYSNSNVNALTNDYKLPYIISVACLNGKYDHSSPCFAEAWMRATNNANGNPTGAIGGMFSYIEQPWTPPQDGQDEMVDILVESYSNNIRHTMGGVSINGNMKVLDMGPNNNAYKGTYNTWILFGDPTLTLRNATPAVMDVTAASTMRGDDTSFAVMAADAEGALATLTFQGEILGSAVIENGAANITFPAPGTTGTATLTVFGYNKKTYITSVEITDGPTPSPLLVIAVATPEELTLGETTTLTANVSGGTGTYTYEWTPAETVTDPTAASTTATPTEVGEIIYVVTVSDGEQTASADVTVLVNNPQPVVCPGPDNFSGTDYVDGDEIGARLSWDAVDYEYTLDRYEIYRSDDGISFDMVQRIVNTPSITHYEVMDPVKSVGIYPYRIIAFYQNNCESDYIEIEVEVTGDDNVGEALAANVAMYPNPTSGMVTIKAEAMRQLTIVNMMGQVVMTKSIDNDEVVLDMSLFNNGMYMVNIITDNGNVVKVLNVLR
ncbi:MAG: T9SS type A sorting domain-containing protein [Bacteroidales bacterium]|nr:T9SS type A sorting domain-containing protein [Bacteroidales bacterium]